MAKRALLIGINKYLAAGADLRGCVNDVKDLSKALVEFHGFRKNDITMLTDLAATKKAMEAGIKALIRDSKKGDVALLHFSGHGSHVPDDNRDESDGRDEILCPADLDWDDPFRDDWLRTTLDGLKALNELNYAQVGDPETHTRIQQYELAFRMQSSVPEKVRRKTLDGLNALNEITYRQLGDEETRTRIQQYEMAFRMQTSVPELTAIDKEPESTYQLYGEDAKKPGTFANSALMARRMVERGVRFVQIYHNNWDTHGNVAGRLPDQCRDVDQACWGLIQDLKRKGLFESTLVIWGGEFGRTIYSQGGLSAQNYGRDHHPRCFTMWMAGGGIKGGTIYGATDDFSYNIVENPVHVRDFHATILHLLGFDHNRFTYRHQGLDQRLTGVEHAHVIEDLLA